KRRTYSVAIRAAEPGVRVVAAQLPVARLRPGDELDPLDPLDALVAVHLGHDDAGRGAVAARERAAVLLVGEQHVGELRLRERQRVLVRLLGRDEAERRRLGPD